MKSKFPQGQKAFILVEIFPLVAFFQLIVVLIFFVAMIAFDASVFSEWIKYINVQEARLGLNTIANSMDICIAHGKDPRACSMELIDRKNMPFLIGAFQTSNFRYDINPHFHERAFCVINAVKVDKHRIPIYSRITDPKTPFDCAGHQILPFNHLSGVGLCRDKYGIRTFYGFGAYESL